MDNNNYGANQELAPVYRHESAFPVPMDMTDIYQYEKLVEEITNINQINGAFYMREFLKAKELASGFYAKVLFDFEQAKNEAKEKYAIAYLEKAEDYAKARGLKLTDEIRKQFAQTDHSYKESKAKEDCYRALVTLMGNKVDKFQAAHDDAKKIFDSMRDPRGSTVALPSGRDSQ